MIHVSPDKLAIGSGPSRQQLTVEQLREQLKGFANAASKADSKGIVLLISDKQVPSDFGLVILDAIVESGIPAVMLSDPDLHEARVPTPTQKPSSPSSPSGR
jgi:biopolymer transport protein ExbD